MDNMNSTTDQNKIVLTQTFHPPFDDFGLVEAHHKLVSENLKWSETGILIDQAVGEQKAALITLLEQHFIVAVFRIYLDSPEQTLRAIQLFSNGADHTVILRACQGNFFTLEQIQSLDALNELWALAESQSIRLDSSNELDMLDKIFFKPRQKGRGKDFSTETKRKVNMDAHGRCMFQGCGANLLKDEVTGDEGNYGYLAHNVAAADNGPRGTKGLSHKLSDEPSNILLLCDKHHRLVDKIAAADYPAHRLSKMRSEFCAVSDRLLEGLSYTPVNAIAVLWPVQRTPIAPPSDIQINQSLAKMNWRMSSTLMTPSGDNDGIILDSSPDDISALWPNLIKRAAGNILSSMGFNQYRAALFAFGPMPQLIALGAKIGNKQEIIPMLRFRDGNQWTWPADTPQGTNYKIFGLDKLSENENEIILTLSLTNHPRQFENFATEIKLKKVDIRANEFGNGALGHPKDGLNFMTDIQSLLHKLKDEYSVHKIHLLPCASNAACVFFGKAFDAHHPEITVYDFSKKTMEPSLRIFNENSICQVESIADGYS